MLFFLLLMRLIRFVCVVCVDLCVREKEKLIIITKNNKYQKKIIGIGEPFDRKDPKLSCENPSLGFFFSLPFFLPT